MRRKVAVVTGASRGIGLAVAGMLVKENYRVYGLCRSRGTLPGVRWIGCDVSDGPAVRKAFEEILSKETTVDVLINNAGMGISGAAEFASQEDISRQLSVNLEGCIRCTQAVLPSMRKNGGGRIVFISSLAAIFPLPFQSFYSVSKAGLNAFSDALGIEVKPFGIQTCTVMLNDVKTEFTDSRRKNICGDDVYGGRIGKSVSKMEESERRGMAADDVARFVGKLLQQKRMPSHAIAGVSNQILGFLYRVLPANGLLRIIGWIYG